MWPVASSSTCRCYTQTSSVLGYACAMHASGPPPAASAAPRWPSLLSISSDLSVCLWFATLAASLAEERMCCCAAPALKDSKLGCSHGDLEESCLLQSAGACDSTGWNSQGHECVSSSLSLCRSLWFWAPQVIVRSAPGSYHADVAELLCQARRRKGGGGSHMASHFMAALLGDAADCSSRQTWSSQASAL